MGGESQCVPARAAADSRTSPAGSLHVLPTARVLHVEFAAEGAAVLPCLPTTSLHGALAAALMRSSREAHAALFEPVGAREPIRGVTDHPPLPMVLAPMSPVLGTAPLRLSDGESWTARVVLFGSTAIGFEAAIVAGLYEAAARGLGVALGGQRGQFLVRQIASESVHLSRVEPSGSESGCTLSLETPSRLKHRGALVSELSAAALWEALVRRTDALARAYGGGSLHDGRLTEIEPPFRVTASEISLVHVRRPSSRQGRCMTWPGMVGTLQIEVAEDDPEIFKLARSLLACAEYLQIGKGTSFGFGRGRFSASVPRTALSHMQSETS